jgi:hypothetical protein
MLNSAPGAQVKQLLWKFSLGNCAFNVLKSYLIIIIIIIITSVYYFIF